MEHFRQCLNKLAATPPRRKAALIRSLLPGIETALRCGHGLKEIWAALQGEGLQTSYLAHVVAARTGINESDDAKRVDEVFAQAQQPIGLARPSPIPCTGHFSPS